jgi:hypothetical protein
VIAMMFGIFLITYRPHPAVAFPKNDLSVAVHDSKFPKLEVVQKESLTFKQPQTSKDD